MIIPRRFLPPMQILRAFEASARLLSFTAAAQELNLTQSAVSRQVKALEDLLGGELFVRDRQTVRLTAAGEIYAHEVRQALLRLSSATLSFRANPGEGTLRLAVLPTFGARWLAPRLPAFLSAHPGISVNLLTRSVPVDFRTEPVDAAIHFGSPDWPGAELDFLMPETVVPACSPGFRAMHPVNGPADLLKLPLLHLASRPDAWERWFTEQGVVFEQVRGMLLDQFLMASQAAVSGLGIALLPTFLCRDELARGELVPVLDAPLQSSGSYYLAWPAGRSSYPPLASFRAWLRQETGQVAQGDQP
ncbi:MAG: LysR substrate-binding domain-containing protein [Lautropia sp.]|nr:LysR substrate-binding domain-containing protein [Lautropia sp.]